MKRGLDEPPETIYFAAGIAGKTGPFYIALRGIRSAMKTSWRSRWGSNVDRRVWMGTVTWVQINPVTGLPVHADGDAKEDVGP